MFLKNVFSVFIPATLSVLLSLILNRFSPIKSDNWFYSLLFLFVLSFILNLIYAFKAGAENFTEILIVAIVIKLLVALIVIVVYSFLDKPGFFNFSLQFILHYILFTIFEIRYLLYLIKKNTIHEQT